MISTADIVSFLRTHTEHVKVESVGENYVLVDAFSMSQYFVRCCNFYINHTLNTPGKVIGLQLDDFKFRLQIV